MSDQKDSSSKSTLLQQLGTIQNKMSSLFDGVCEPQIDTLSEDQKSQIKSINKANLFTLIGCSKCLLLLAILSHGDNRKLTLIYFGVMLALIASLLTLCRKHLKIYSVTVSLLLSALSSITILLSPQLITYAYACVYITPLLVFILSRDMKLTLVNSALQILYLGFKLNPLYTQLMLAAQSSELQQLLKLQENIQLGTIIICLVLGYVKFLQTRSRQGDLLESKNKTEIDLLIQQKFLFKFSNDLKNPINSMLGNLQMAQLPGNPVKQQECINDAKSSGELLLLLIDNILDSSKMEVGMLEVDEKPTNIYKSMEQLWNVSTEFLKLKGLYGRLSISKNVPQGLLFDNSKLSQILQNFVRNGVRFTEKGAIRVSVNWIPNTHEINDECFEPHPYNSDDEGLFEKDEFIDSLHRSCLRKNSIVKNSNVLQLSTYTKQFDEKLLQSNTQSLNYPVNQEGVLKIAISDSGCGMSEEFMQRLFTKFPSIDPKSNRKTVQGLSTNINKKLIDRLGGGIRVYSREKSGTTFILCFKMKTVDSQLVEQESTNNSGNLGSGASIINYQDLNQLQALVIDENPQNADLNKKYLERGNVNTSCVCRTAEDALQKYKASYEQKRPYHIITVDLDMPISETKEALQKIREFEEDQNSLFNSQIILISGNCYESDIKECLNPDGKIRANNFFRKPIHYQEFQRSLKKIQKTLAEQLKPREPFLPKKVLLVDDENMNRNIVGTVLSREKREFLEAANGQEACEIYEKNWKDIGLVFMDCQMPIKDGYEAATAIRKIQSKLKIPKIKILGLSGNQGPEYVKKVKDAGMDNLITKPIKISDIVDIQKQTFEQYN